MQEEIGNVEVNVSNMLIPHWVGVFTRLEFLVEVKGYLQDGSCITYDVDEKGRLVSNFQQPILNSRLNCYVIRVVAWDGKFWHVDPNLEDVRPHWAFEGKPLWRLQWDPGGLVWNNVSTGKQVPFLQYVVKLGRCMLSFEMEKMPATLPKWRSHGVVEEFKKQFWTNI